MGEQADLLITNAGELLTLDAGGPGPAIGAVMNDPGIVRDGAVAIRDGKVLEGRTLGEEETREPLPVYARSSVERETVIEGKRGGETGRIIGGSRGGIVVHPASHRNIPLGRHPQRHIRESSGSFVIVLLIHLESRDRVPQPVIVFTENVVVLGSGRLELSTQLQSGLGMQTEPIHVPDPEKSLGIYALCHGVG